MLDGSPTLTEPGSEGAPDEHGGGGTARAPHAALLLAIFLILAVALTFPNVTRLRTFIAGDSGDSLLNLWIMRRVQIGLPHGWHALWNPPIFYPAHGTLAYSDTLFPVALVHWPLRTILGDTLAFNVIYLGSWVLSSWCVYRLTARFVRHWGAAFVAALAYTYAAIRLVHQGHFQLVVGGALVPLVVLLLLLLFDAPSVRRGLALGAAFVMLTLTASYFGAMMAVVVVIVAGGLLVARRPGPRRPYVVALAAAAGLVVVCVAPFAFKYEQLQRHPEFRRTFEPSTATHVGDFAGTGSHDYVLDHVPFVSSASRPSSRGIENRAFPGFVALAFGAVGVVLVLRRGRRRRGEGERTEDRPADDGGRVRGRDELLLLAMAGLVVLVLSFGDWIRVGGHRVYLPFAALRRIVPGFAGIRAVSRLELAAQLALVLFAAVGIDALLRRTPSRWRIAVVGLLAVIVVAESAMALVFVRVPTSADDGGVGAALRARPTGVVLELPISSADRGVVWPTAESPRQLVALHDHDPRVNGYSGFQPPGFDLQAAVLNHFPKSDALGLVHRLGVRYVVLRTQVVGEIAPATAVPPTLRDGGGRYDPQTAAQMIAALPPGAASSVVRLPGGYLIVLTG